MLATSTPGSSASASASPSVSISASIPISHSLYPSASASASASQPSDGDNNDDGFPSGRVDASQLAVLENPLSKSDRYTVIKGRLPDSDPFMRAASRLGLSFMSAEMRSSVPDQTVHAFTVSEEARVVNFMRDIEAFNKELNRDFKIPIIGGGQLGLYALAQEVMRLGGLKNVVQNRAFRIVGQQLELPKSCTSAAFVLKNAYERLLYQYEQMITFGISPANPSRTVDMKSIVSEKKKRDQTKRRSSNYPFPTTSVFSAAAGPRRLEPVLCDPSGRISKKKSAGKVVIRYLQGAKQIQDVLTSPPHTHNLFPVDLYNTRASFGFANPVRTEAVTHQQPECGVIPFSTSQLPGGILTLPDWPTTEEYASMTPCDDNSGIVERAEGENGFFQINRAVAFAFRPPPASLPGLFFFEDFLATGRISINLEM
jgi:hypothetical protein